MEEQRESVRYPVVLPVRYNASTYIEGYAHTCDISVGGAKIEVQREHRFGDRLGLMIEDRAKPNQPLCLEADVVWQKRIDRFNEACKYLIGVEFKRIDELHKSIILSHAEAHGMLIPKRPKSLKIDHPGSKFRYINYGF